MDWLQSLLWDPSSVAHIVFLYAFVVAMGVYLGKIKIFGVSLGVTFVLFAGILMGHFGFTADTHILHFIREFGLILFVFCIGLQVGPSFFSSFKIEFKSKNSVPFCSSLNFNSSQISPITVDPIIAGLCLILSSLIQDISF